MLGVPLIVIVPPDQLAVTPAGKPVTAPIPVAPVVVCVMLVIAVFTHNVGLELAGVTVLSGLTVILNVVVVAHRPAVGVNVYVVVAVLFIAGDHVPVIPLLDVVCNAANAAPLHIGATAVNVGVTFGFTVILNVVVVAH